MPILALTLFGNRRPLLTGVAIVLAILGFAVLGFYRLPRARSDAERMLPQVVVGSIDVDEGEDYVSSEACESCHQEHYTSWHRTYHRSMTQLTTPETVLAPFDDIHLQSRGRDYHLQRRGEEFWVTMADPDWEIRKAAQGVAVEHVKDPPTITRKVVLATGSHRMQTYWISSFEGENREGRKLRQLPWYFHLEQQRWIASEDSFLIPPDADRAFEVWDHNCINCHSVAGNPNIDLQTGYSNSTVAEFGIACEACHGPGQSHVLYHRGRSDQHTNAIPDRADAVMFNPARADPQRVSQMCGQCHSNFEPRDQNDWRRHGFRYRAGENLTQFRYLLQPGVAAARDHEYLVDGYWPDGTNCVGGDEYFGLIDSPCDQGGEFSCLSCHSMHHSNPNKQLADRMDGNHACLQCHTSYADRISEHTHHPAESSGSLCYNCHMPHTSYALFSALRSHRIDSPSAEVSHRTGRPNACNQCHLDRSLDWSMQHLADWYDMPTVTLSEDEQQISASILWMLRGDALQRAVTAWTMGWPAAHEPSGTDWQAPLLAQLLNDPYPAVRFVAYNSLRRLPQFEDFEYDFAAPPEVRAEASQAAMDLWQSSSRQQASSASQRILRNPDGTLMHPVMQRLLESRNDRPVSIQE